MSKAWYGLKIYNVIVAPSTMLTGLRDLEKMTCVPYLASPVSRLPWSVISPQQWSPKIYRPKTKLLQHLRRMSHKSKWELHFRAQLARLSTLRIAALCRPSCEISIIGDDIILLFYHKVESR